MHCYLLLRPLRKYYQKLSKRVNNRDMESGQDDGDELQSIRVDRNQPQQYYTPCQQEFTPVSYQNPGTKSIFKSVGYVTVCVIFGLICQCTFIYMTVRHPNVPEIYPVICYRSQSRSSERLIFYPIVCLCPCCFLGC